MPGRGPRSRSPPTWVKTTSSTADDVVLYVIQLERQTGELGLVGGYAGEVVATARSSFSFR